MTGPHPWRPGNDQEPVFESCGPDGESVRCTVCGAVDEVDQDEMPSMAGYGEDTYTRCTRYGSSEATDPIFGWRTKRADWPPQPGQEQARR